MSRGRDLGKGENGAVVFGGGGVVVVGVGGRRRERVKSG